MILADTSVWIDHLRAGDEEFAALLNAGQVLIHPFVVGELALGNLHPREVVLHALSNLPSAQIASHAEVMALVERQALHGAGIGYVDAHLLAAVKLTPGAKLWTKDRRLRELAVRLACA